jgi:hypothetical protein
MRVIMLAIIDEAGRKFNADKLDGISRRDSPSKSTGRGELGAGVAMGTRFRWFWVGEDGRLHHIGFQRFVKIFHDGTETVRELAGRMVPVIEAIYETTERRATQLISARGHRFPFDPGGRLDVETQRRLYPWTALLDEHAEGLLKEPGNVCRIGSRIAANRIRKEILFDPTPDQIRAVLLALRIITLPRPRPSLRLIKRRDAVLKEDSHGPTLDRQGGGEHAVVQSGGHSEVDVPAAAASREGRTAHPGEHPGSERLRQPGQGQAREPRPATAR